MVPGIETTARRKDGRLDNWRRIGALASDVIGRLEKLRAAAAERAGPVEGDDLEVLPRVEEKRADAEAPAQVKQGGKHTGGARALPAHATSRGLSIALQRAFPSPAVLSPLVVREGHYATLRVFST